jgi:hypothetical protein
VTDDQADARPAGADEKDLADANVVTTIREKSGAGED